LDVEVEIQTLRDRCSRVEREISMFKTLIHELEICSREIKRELAKDAIGWTIDKGVIKRK